jgi:16S rRNA (adenine1518-N6/adenine1519-N6)-dimethyltransferase
MILLNYKNLLKKYKIKPLKKMGQNFLVDKSVLKEILNAADLSSKDIVLEIGPGLGVLTIELAGRAKKVIAVEKDEALCHVLENILKEQKINNVKVINKDVLQISNYSNLPNYSNYKIVANLPYYIVPPVIRKFLETKNKPKQMILMVQKEVAQRICAKPGKMSLLSVAVQFYANVKIINYVSKKSFYPQPKVDSAILRITPRNKAELSRTDTEKFFNLVKAGFSSKRKMLINNLLRELKIKNCKLKIVFDQVQLGQKLRAENLSIKDWLNLYEKLKPH